MPVMWNSGASPKTPTFSLSWIRALNPSELKTRLPWVLVAPLGTPLVPEV